MADENSSPALDAFVSTTWMPGSSLGSITDSAAPLSMAIDSFVHFLDSSLHAFMGALSLPLFRACNMPMSLLQLSSPHLSLQHFVKLFANRAFLLTFFLLVHAQAPFMQTYHLHARACFCMLSNLFLGLAAAAFPDLGNNIVLIMRLQNKERVLMNGYSFIPS